ncbi:FAD-binding oxidoreductase [Ahniella affigens]|uniref:FAD-binding oxidoreductase n=1 Tax=Ahniella affigens TaxID=2021234 RepID=A0A2P1PXT0_9GAMM|nr:FAD-linked oxidase C-terminal domain-containing protein [Ahniella affigens]AVP99647.1 FAD-binding oxidoreductase [Ahniella affigens]
MPSEPESHLSADFRAALLQLFPGDQCHVDLPTRHVYGYDNSRRLQLPDAVLIPREQGHLPDLVRLCRQYGVAIVPRGRGTNTTGATIPIQGGVVLSFERLNRIIEINPDDRLAVVEPGVLNGDLQSALKPHGLFWAPDPTSAPFATIGGNLACNAGGPRAVKYGACRDNVLGLGAIDGHGRALRLGTRTTKGATGYDLMRLLIGAEGTLGLITDATLKLLPLPKASALLRALYADVETAAEAVTRIMRGNVVPSALEFMDATAIRLARDIGGAAISESGAMLMIECDGEPESVPWQLARLQEAASGRGLLELVQADTASATDALWKARKALSPALRTLAPKKINEDVVVPVSCLPTLVRATEQWSASAGFPIVCFGHAGNGNLHVNLLIDPANARHAEAARSVLAELFKTVIALGGTLSGEHGIGLDKRDFVPSAFNAATLEMMYDLKQWLDPDGIMNPGKLLPPADARRRRAD